jgi:hypothetical protein
MTSGADATRRKEREAKVWGYLINKVYQIPP